MSLIICFSLNNMTRSNKINLKAEIRETSNYIQNDVNEVYLESTANDEDIIWKLEIPKIDLEAHISEGTEKNVLDEFIGHFEETSKNIGNIGLAAHNRGYKVNYFERIKELEIGDEIIYTYGKTIRRYKVIDKNIISDSDWTKLENTEDNRITLITCLEDEPEYRRYIQALEE